MPASMHVTNQSVGSKRVLITGASGSLGGALARHLARSGVSMSLWGRDGPRLASVAQACESKGACVQQHLVDLTDLSEALAALNLADEGDGIDLALLVAGQGDICPEGLLVEPADQVARLGHINFVAPAALAAALADRMANRGSGRIVLVGSSAAFHALPFAAAYAGSKAGLAHFADALRLAVKDQGVSVTLVSPGFLETTTARRADRARPFALSFEQAAARIIAAAQRGEAHRVFPWQFAAFRWLGRLLPGPVLDRLLQALPRS